MSVLVSYYIQGELGESLETPNAFLLNAPNGSRLTFQQFLQGFPLPSSDLHFRFRKEDKQFGYIWQDIKQPNEIIPTYNSCVTAKILRLGDVTAVKRRSRLKLKASAPAPVRGNAAALRNDGSASEPLKKPSHLGVKVGSRSAEAEPGDEHVSYSPMSSPNGSSGGASASSSGTKKLQQPSSSSTLVQEQAPSEDLLFGGDDHGSGGDDSGGGGGGVDSFASKPIMVTPGKKHVTVNAYVPRDDDIDEDEAPSGGGDGGSGTGSAAPIVEPLMMDLMGDAASDSKSASAAPAVASEALGFKQEMDRRHKQAAEDLDAARLRLQESVNNWATNNGEKRNVRTLLSTMHTLVNWPNCNWKPLTLSDVIEAKKVKLHYRKAMMVVHPDKASHLPPDGQYISRRVFEGINEAYHEFEKKESV